MNFVPGHLLERLETYEKLSYMIPPVFSYKHPDMSDEAFEPVRRAKLKDRITIDRPTDDAQYEVFDVLSQLIQDDVTTPFIAVHDLKNIDTKNHQLVTLSPIEIRPFSRRFDCNLDQHTGCNKN